MERMNFEMQVDEKVRHMRQFLDIRTGFGEDHIKSRMLHNLFKHFDLDHKGTMTIAEFGKVLEQMAIAVTRDELVAAFNRFDTDLRGTLTFKECADAFFGASYAPFGDPDVRHLVESIRAFLHQREADGTDAFRGLTRLLLTKSTRAYNSLVLSKEGLFNNLQLYGVLVTLPECTVLVKKFDRFNKNELCVPDFLRAIRGHMPQPRVDVVREAFNHVDKDRKGFVTLDQLAACADSGAVVAAGRRRSLVAVPTAGEHAYNEFVKEWASLSDLTKGKITWQDFLDYYTDISAATDVNIEFDTFVRQTWRLHIPGTTPREIVQRVLVTHRDGHQSIEEIHADISLQDVEKLRRTLELQGIRDVSKIESYH